MTRDNPVTGAGFLLRGIRLMMRPGLRRYLVVPVLVNVLVFALVGGLGFSYFGEFLDSMLPESSWFSFLRWLLWPLFALAALLVIFYTFTVLANLIAAPFNSRLAAKTEQLLTGSLPPEGNDSLAASILPSILDELRKLGYFTLRAIPLLLLFLVPVINVAAPFLWLAFTAWFLALEYSDYPLGNRGVGLRQQRSQLGQRRLTALGFGGALTFMMMIPVLNLAAMPAAVAGATLMWCESRETGASS